MSDVMEVETIELYSGYRTEKTYSNTREVSDTQISLLYPVCEKKILFIKSVLDIKKGVYVLLLLLVLRELFSFGSTNL